jgi:hypothetical protein
MYYLINLFTIEETLELPPALAGGKRYILLALAKLNIHCTILYH